VNYDTLLSLIGHYGYFALFFALWLGIVGMPIPDEVVVMTGGAAAGSELLHPVPAFLLTYLGVISGLSIGYFVGRFAGNPALEWLKRKRNFEKYVVRSEEWFRRYGDFALVMSYFFPVVRHVIPYIAGMNRMTFPRYCMISFTTGFVWTTVYFVLGRFVGKHAEVVGMLIYRYGIVALGCILAVAAIAVAVKIAVNKRKTMRGEY
jgi:membrane protein DedA with SNARE-associated domain